MNTLSETDLIRSMEWLDWVQRAHESGVAQNKIDTAVINRIQRLEQSLSPIARELYADAMKEVFKHPRPGTPEKCMTSACETIILMAEEQDWERYLKHYDQSDTWRTIWDDVRGIRKDIIQEKEMKKDSERIVKFLSSGLSKKDWWSFMDMGIYNNTIRGYLISAMRNAGFSKDDIRKALTSLHEDFEFLSAADAENEYLKFK